MQTLKEMRQKHQPDVSFNTRHGRYYRTWDPDYIPNKWLIKSVCPKYLSYWTFTHRVRNYGIEKAIQMWLPQHWGDRSMYMKSYKYKES